MTDQPTEGVPPVAQKPKGKLALYWAASCGGCEIAVLQIGAKILDVAAAFDIVFWPCATDGKVRDVENMPDKSIDVCLFNGGVRTSEQEYMAQLLRKKAKILVAFGSCAQEGGIPGLANMASRQEVFDTAYRETPSTDNPQDVRPQHKTEVPEGTLYLPVFYDRVKTLNQTVPVDYYLPGCPPEGDNIWATITAILEGKLPPPGSVIGPTKSVCDECSRDRTEKRIKKFYRTWELKPDAETCLLEQGIFCCGIATRASCGALCPEVNSPCIGCHGPNDGVEEFGARLMSAIASVIDSEDPEEIERIIDEGFPDPIGTFYRFSLASSLLRGKKRTSNGNGAGGATTTKAEAS